MIKIHPAEQDNGAKSLALANIIADWPLRSMILFARNRRHDVALS